MARKLPDDRFKKKRIEKNTFRLFLGIFPPSEYIYYFRDVMRALDKQKRNLKPTPVGQIHLTLKFIGSEVSPSSKDIVFEELMNLQGNYPKPEILIKKIQFGFEYQKDPQHILADVENSDSLVDLYNFVHERIKRIGLEDTIRWKDKHAVDFHITLARLKPNMARSIGRAVKEEVEKIRITPPEPFIADDLEFVESVLTPQGPVYKKLGSIKL